MKKIAAIFIVLIALVPSISFAQTLTTTQRCTAGTLLSGPADIQTTAEYKSCCVNSPVDQGASCNNLTKRQQCSFGLISGSQCVFIIDSAALYKQYCIDIPSSIMDPNLKTLCAEKSKDMNDMCKWGIYSVSDCNNAFVDKYSICQSSSAPARYSDEWYSQGCDRIERFSPNNSPQVDPVTAILAPIYTQETAPLTDTVVETSCANVNLSKVDLASFWRFFLWVRCYIGKIVPFLLTIAVIIFLWNIINYIIKPNALKADERKKYIIAGLVGLFVIVGMWGLVAFTSNTLGLGTVVPQLPYSYTK